MPDFYAMTADQIRAHRETVLLRLLIRLSQIETNELVERLHDHGHEGVQRTYIALLANIDTEGTRLVEIARRLGVSRQAASQMVKEVQRRGFLERLDDPSDGRAILVRHNPAGRALLLDALALMNEIEAEYAAIVSQPALDQTRRTLRRIADTVAATTSL